MTSVVIVDDQALLRRGLSLVLETIDGITIVGEASHGQEALAVIAKTHPDVVLTDARMPGMDGVELVRRLATDEPDLPVLVLTTFDDSTIVRDALDAGAAGFLLKDTSPKSPGDAIAAVSEGGLVIDPRVARAAMRRDVEPEDEPLAILTPTERQVGEQVASGATNAEIAATLCMAEGTVKNHISALLRKLGQRDRTALALLLYRELN